MTMVEASVIPIEMKTTPSTAQMKPRRDAKTLGALSTIFVCEVILFIITVDSLQIGL